MSHLIRKVTSCTILAINRSSNVTLRTVLPVHVRTIFSSSSIGLDNFKLAREQYVSRHAPSIDSFKKRFLDSVNKPDAQIFTEDLRNMIMSADSDEEVNAVIQALKKYNTNKLKLTDYHFGSPIMRLLYIRNKPDLAMQLFMDESLKNIFNDSGSALILLNKLVEDKRYDDAIKVFEYGMQRGFTTTSGRTYPTDAVTLTIEALYRQNTKQSLAKAKELMTKVIERDADINPRTAAMMGLLAIQHDESSFAMEIIGAVRAQNLTTIQNIRAICYAKMGRAEEAINVVHLLADQPPIDNDHRRVFPLVLQHIKKAVENSKDEDLKTRFEDLSKFVTQNNRLSSTDLSEFLNEPISRRQAIATGRLGVQQAPSGSFQRSGSNFRDIGFRGGFNQKASNLRQDTRGNSYIRDNRYQSSRFGGANYASNERRSQNSFNENERLSNRNRNSSLNENFRQDNRIEQSNLSSARVNQSDSTTSSRLRERENDSNTSRRSGTKVGTMETTSTSPIPQRSTRTNEDNPQQLKRNRNVEKNDNKSSSSTS
ncbi:unnamed protein product [Rotaria sp. Silwood1]|nr:unnamed protein product [Rotaria sp. Silwood1]